MKTVLTIDFDIIMSSLMNVYESVCDHIGECTPINSVELEHPELTSYDLDMTIYNKITEYLKTVKCDNIYFIDNHKDIVDLINYRDSYNLINLDYHGDYASGDFVGEPNIMNNGNWVYFLFKSGLLDTYTIVTQCDYNMDKLEFNEPNDYLNQYNLIVTNILTFDLEEVNPDMIVICSSYQWVAERYWPLLEEWKKLGGKHDN